MSRPCIFSACEHELKRPERRSNLHGKLPSPEAFQILDKTSKRVRHVQERFAGELDEEEE